MDEVKLDNGLSLYFYDQSRPVIGDRSLVKLLIHAPINVEENHFADCGDPEKSYKEFVAEFGNRVFFQNEKIRNFVSNDEIDATLEQMKQELLGCNLGYLSRPAFAAKYVLKKYRDWLEDGKWRKVAVMEGYLPADRKSEPERPEVRPSP